MLWQLVQHFSGIVRPNPSTSSRRINDGAYFILRDELQLQVSLSIGNRVDILLEQLRTLAHYAVIVGFNQRVECMAYRYSIGALRSSWLKTLSAIRCNNSHSEWQALLTLISQSLSGNLIQHAHAGVARGPA